MYKQILFDQLTPVAMYSKIKEIVSSEVTMLFESVVNSSDGSFSFITIGAKERVLYKDDQTIYIKDDKQEILKQNPFEFLKEYYQNIDQDRYKELSDELGFSFVDGFIGFIAYDMVKVFEPVLKESMDGLVDTLGTPDLDLVRPKIILAYSHKSSKLTLILNDNSMQDVLDSIEDMLLGSFTHHQLKKVYLLYLRIIVRVFPCLVSFCNY